MDKIIQYRSFEKTALLFTREHLSIILNQVVGPGVTDRTALRLLAPTIIEKTALSKNTKVNIKDTAIGAGLGGVMSWPWLAEEAFAGSLSQRRPFFKKAPYLKIIGIGSLLGGLLGLGGSKLNQANKKK